MRERHGVQSTPPNAGVLVAWAGLALAAPAALAQTPFEVSEDGQFSATVRAGETAFGVRSADTVPFGTNPDQEVTLRRQIGGVQIADMNDDGLNDVVAVVYISNAFPPYTEFQDQILYGLGSAGIDLTPGWLSDDATHTGDVQIGDIDRDGFPDIVTIHGGSIRPDNVRVYYGGLAGPSTTAAYVSTTGPAAWGTAGDLVDFDNDGDLDLFTSNQGLSPDPLRPNFGFRNLSGSFATQPSWISADSAVQNGVDAADINGDGWVDVAVAKGTNFVSGIYLGQPDALPKTTPSLLLGPLEPDRTEADRGAVFADFDQDGDQDIFFNGRPGELYDTTGFELISSYMTMPPFESPQETRAFDVDGDGDLDLAEVHFSDGRAHIYLNRGGVLDAAPSWTYDAPQVGTSLAFGDVNNDGRPDLVVGYAGDVSLRVFFAEVVCEGDANGDGVTNADDLLVVLGNFGDAVPGGADDGDFDQSGIVNADDLLVVLGAFGCTG